MLLSKLYQKIPGGNGPRCPLPAGALGKRRHLDERHATDSRTFFWRKKERFRELDLIGIGREREWIQCINEQSEQCHEYNFRGMGITPYMQLPTRINSVRRTVVWNSNLGGQNYFFLKNNCWKHDFIRCWNLC